MSRYPKLALLTFVLRPPWETLGKAEKLGRWVQLRGVVIFLAKKIYHSSKLFSLLLSYLLPFSRKNMSVPLQRMRTGHTGCKTMCSWCLLLEEMLNLLVLPLLLNAYVHLLQAVAGCCVHLLIELGLCFLPGLADLPSGPFQQRINSVLFEACITFTMAHSSSFLLQEKGVVSRLEPEHSKDDPQEKFPKEISVPRDSASSTSLRKDLAAA